MSVLVIDDGEIMNLVVHYITLFVFFGISICDDDVEYNKFLQASISQGLKIFSGIDEIVRYFRENETSTLSKSILETFLNDCLFMEDPGVPDDKDRKPFIVIEGNHRSSREVIGMRLSRILGGRFLIHPAPCLAKYLEVVPKRTLLRRAYYALSLYAQAFNVKVQLSLNRAVVLNGYWLDQLAFHLTQSFPRGPLPPVNSNIFDFPEGLLRPDVIFYLNIPDNLRSMNMTTRSPLNWKPRSLQLYTDLQARYPIVIQTLTGVYGHTVDAIYQHMLENLVTYRNIWPSHSNIEVDYDINRVEMQHRNDTESNKHKGN
ncbi:UMP kinase activity protein [Homalodisca vitripennis]|nr:UMP kinase activity protein [Homalodisca vitripennis]